MKTDDCDYVGYQEELVPGGAAAAPRLQTLIILMTDLRGAIVVAPYLVRNWFRRLKHGLRKRKEGSDDDHDKQIAVMGR